MKAKLMHPLFQALRELGLPADDFAVFGSGPLVANGIIFECNDLDLIARGLAWKQALHLGKVGVAGNGAAKVELAGGKIEVFDTWAPGEWDVSRLIDEAEVIEGIRFVTVDQVLKWKRLRNRPKDGIHIHRIEEYLAVRADGERD